jgi:hypothetical protein
MMGCKSIPMTGRQLHIANHRAGDPGIDVEQVRLCMQNLPLAQELADGQVQGPDGNRPLPEHDVQSPQQLVHVNALKHYRMFPILPSIIWHSQPVIINPNLDG